MVACLGLDVQAQGASTAVEVGAGLGYAMARAVASTQSDIMRATSERTWGAVALEALARIQVATRLSTEFGLIADTSLDQWYRQPVILMILGP